MEPLSTFYKRYAWSPTTKKDVTSWRFDARCYFNVRSKAEADMSKKSKKMDMLRSNSK